ncbi:hypothetical protein [Halobacillus litoralis]|uniref:hypothetical protein n=1 Tax=Halobacillus litoralis TaxID=45668 RepID=UPI001CD3AA34|nr:hypothetical protein [Halobacillus litoralis]MCA1021654.1 hypothetical protein [Halobacillus litoralis]
MGVAITLILLGILFLAVVAMISSAESSMEEPKRQALAEKLESISHTKKFVKLKGLEAILYDNATESIHILNGSEVTTLSKKDIMQVEIVEDKESISQSSRSSQIGRAALGGLVAGGAGFIVGGLSGKKTHHDEVSEMSLRLVVDDADNPIREFTFYKNDYKLKTNSSLYKRQHGDIFEWFKTVEVLIARADKEDKQSETVSTI